MMTPQDFVCDSLYDGPTDLSRTKTLDEKTGTN